MRAHKINSFSPKQNQQVTRINSPGFLTRKPDRKAPFTRKKAIQNVHAESKYSPFPTRLSRQKRSPRAEMVLPSNSLKDINSQLQEEIKYLSPKHAQSSLNVKNIEEQSMGSSKNSSASCKFNNLLSNASLFSTFDDMAISDNMQMPSGISIDSLAGKNFAIETTQHSGRDWFGLEGENEKLKEENSRLKEQISELRIQLEQSKERQFTKKNQSKTECPKCKSYEPIQRFRTENRQLHCLLSTHKQEIEQLKRTVQVLKCELKEQRSTVVMLSNELDASRQAEEQLQSLINNLKQKIDMDTLELKHLSIQQDILMRRKDEFQKLRVNNLKDGIQRDNLKRVLTEYKQKIDLLRKVIAKNRLEKKANRFQQMQISLQLSMDSTVAR